MSDHRGHRERLSRKIALGRLENFPPHEVLEFLLFYAIPQKNVNDLAHALIKRFGSLGAVLHADKAALIEIKGVGPHTAEFLRVVGQAVDEYLADDGEDRIRLVTLREALSEIRKQAGEIRESACGVLFEDNNGYMLHCEVMRWESAGSDEIRALVDMALRYHAHNIVIVRFKPSAKSLRVRADVEEAAMIVRLMTKIDVYTVDYLFVSGEKVESLREAGYMADEKIQVREDSEFPYGRWFQ